MRIVTANRLSDGRVIYAGVDNQPVDSIEQASVLDEAAAEIVLAEVAGRPDVFVNPLSVRGDRAHAFGPRPAEGAHSRGRPDGGPQHRGGRRLMYRYDEFDHALVRERVEEFSDQVARPRLRRPD